jgi:hypothetical protein
MASMGEIGSWLVRANKRHMDNFSGADVSGCQRWEKDYVFLRAQGPQGMDRRIGNNERIMPRR